MPILWNVGEIMSFYRSARRVRNPELSIDIRHGAFKECIARHAGAIGFGYRETYQRISNPFGFCLEQRPSLEQLLLAIDTLETEYHRFQHRLNVFARSRIRNKLRGCRCPSRTELQTLAIRTILADRCLCENFSV